MEWFVGLIALIGALYLGFKLGSSTKSALLKEALKSQAHDRSNYLHVLRRELANYMIWGNADNYLNLYKEIHNKNKKHYHARLEEAQKRLNELCAKYPQYSDFDLVGTRTYVLYVDTLSGLQNQEIEQRYNDIAEFQALSSICSHNWKTVSAHSTSDQELKFLSDYVRSVKDTKLQSNLSQAVHEIYISRNASGASGKISLDLPDFEIQSVEHFAENRMGIKLKKTGEYGLYGFSIADNGKIYKRYYRTDKSFQKEYRLNILHGVLETETQ